MPRTIRLRYPGTCAVCSADLQRGTPAWWDSETKKAWCEEHGDSPGPPGLADAGATHAAPPAPVGPVSSKLSTPSPRGDDILGTTGGGSALAEHERRKAREQAVIRERWSRFPKVGELIINVTDETKDTAAWGKGGRAEAALSEKLGLVPGVRVLHDRLKPGSKTGNIDHLVVAPNAVWVIDAKAYSGKLELRNRGTFFRPAEELWVNGRRRENLVEGVEKQADAVARILAPSHPDIPVRPALCFIGTEWDLFASPFEHKGVVITWPKKLYQSLAKPGLLDRSQVEAVQALLARSLRPAIKR